MGRHTKRKADANQPALVEVIRGLGATFQHTHAIPGALDGIIGFAGIDVRAEIKDPEKEPSKRKLTKAEQDTFNNWKGRTPVVIETPEDVIQLLKQLQQESAA